MTRWMLLAAAAAMLLMCGTASATTYSDNLSVVSNLQTDSPEGIVGTQINFNFTMKTMDGVDCPSCSYLLNLSPSETNLQHSQSGALVEGNFTPSRRGIYSIRVNVTGNGDSEIRKYVWVINATNSETVDYYFRELNATHGQPTSYGTATDAGSLLFEPPTSDEEVSCAVYVGLSIDSLPDHLFGIFKHINYSIWYDSGGEGYTGIQRYGTTGTTLDYKIYITTPVTFDTFNFSVDWGNDYFWAWYFMTIKLKGYLPYLYSNATHPSYANITYTYSTTPDMKSISNENVQIFSATSPATDDTKAKVVVNGTGSTYLVVQMPNTALTYTTTWDGGACTGGDCSFTQSSGELNFTLNLGSEHTINISEQTYACSYEVCVDTNGWWQDGGVLNSTATPIQHAIDNSSSGDTMYIWNGSYTENVDISTTHLTVEGEGRDVVTVTAASSADDVFYVTGDYTNITGITVMGATGFPKAGIHIRAAEHCNISTNNATGNNYGIYLATSDCHDTIVDGNVANSNDRDGIHLDTAINNNITNNTANSNTRNGITLWYATGNNITNNTASNNYRGIYVYDHSDNNIINNNTFLSNRYGIHIRNYCDYNELTDNNASNNDYGTTLRASQYNTFTTNSINSNNIWGVTLYLSNHNIFDRLISSNNIEYDCYAWYTSLNNTLLNCDLSSTTSMMNDSTSQWIIKYDTYNNITDFDDTTINQTVSPTNVTTDIDPTIDDYTVSMDTLSALNMSSGVDTVNIKLVSYASGGHSSVTAYSSNTSEVLTINIGTYVAGEAVQLRANNIRTQTVNANAAGVATFTYDAGFSEVDLDIDQSVNTTFSDATNYSYTIDAYSNTSFTSTINITWNGNGSECNVSIEMPLITTTGYTGLSYSATNTTTAVRVSNISSQAFCNFTISPSAAGSTYIVLSPSTAEKTSNLPVAVAAGLAAGTITVIIFLRRRRR